MATDEGILAEKLRWLGGLRYDVASVIEVIKGKRRIAKLIIGEEVIEEDFISENFGFLVNCQIPFTKLNEKKISFDNYPLI